MQRYAKVSIKFWTDEKILSLSEKTKLLALYLLTSPHSNSLGLYYLPLQYVSADLGFGVKEVMEGIKELEKIQFCIYDENTRVVFLPNFLTYNSFQNVNQVKGAVAKLSELPDTVLFKEFRNILENFDDGIYSPLIEAVDNRLKRVRATVFEPFPNSSETVTETVPKKERIPYDELVKLYHELCPSLPRVVKLTESRKRYLQARWRENSDMEFWRGFFKRVEDSDFLTGRADYGKRSPFKADFEWILRPSNFVKILEGKYDNRTTAGKDIDIASYFRR